jgi:NADH-quinone oxidoreductase subunit F
MTRLANVEQLNKLRETLVAAVKPDMPYVSICAGTGCLACGCRPVVNEFRRLFKELDLEDKILLKTTGCHGFCERGPVVVIHPQGIFYQQMKPEDVEEVVRMTLLEGKVVHRLLYHHPQTGEEIIREEDVPFYKHQQRIVFADNGRLDPRDIEDYIRCDGYQALPKALFEMSPEEVIAEVKKSGLRGRGGAGFPTGVKWEFCRKSPGEEKFIICNADEGDPGAYMDRSVLEGNPHLVVEGMVIGGYAIGANEAYVYVRNEYPLAVETLVYAIEEAKRRGLLGRDILGSGFNFNVKISRGGGAFVCGEETALIASVEGRVGEPRPRPPYPAVRGLWDKPTNVNNVETWANVPHIIRKGADWFAGIGTETSKGTKIFSLVGKINNTGLVEVPMGFKLCDIIYDIGGGIPKGKKYKAVQTGGPSGGCIPAKMISLPIDYEKLAAVDSIMGSGGLIVMDESTCMVDVARYFLEFLKEESCGQCVPCREGIERSLEVLNRIVAGEGTPDDIPLLEELAVTIADFSLCGLGQTAPNPLLSTLRHFRHEYEEHIKYKRCNAAVCNKIISSPCQHTCPIDTKAPVYIAQIAHGDFDAAWKTISMDNPLPGICGRVCNHPCERKCRAGDGGDAISIRGLKRFVTDYAAEKGLKLATADAKSKRDEKVAIIGAGPAGLACGQMLALGGFGVTIFDSLPKPGGMMLAGIPEYRLPRRIIEQEVERLREAGVEIQCNKTLGKDFSLDDLLKKQGYKAVFLATGAHRSMPLGIEGEDAKGVMKSMTFLTAVNVHGKKDVAGKHVAVVGGGNSAVDAARVALRLPGTEKVTIIYRRTRAEMPAFKEEVDAALEEGIEIHFLANPVKVHVDNGQIKAVDCIRMELGDFDSSGRRRPVPIEGSEFTIEIDTLITAIGERPDTSYASNGSALKITRWDSIEVDEETMATNVEGVFAGGDVVTGPNTVIDAIAAGKRAAESIERWVDGRSLERTYEVTKPYMKVEAVTVPDEEMMDSRRAHAEEMPVEKRVNSFDEIAPALTKDEAMREARRCLRCDLS